MDPASEASMSEVMESPLLTLKSWFNYGTPILFTRYPPPFRNSIAWEHCGFFLPCHMMEL